MIDFSALVLGPVMATFGQPITVTPMASQPGAAAYSTNASGSQLNGVYASKKVDIPLEGGGFMSTLQPTLGIRTADFMIPPMQGDLVALALGEFEIVDITTDGQGGADCELRNLAEPTSTTDEDGA